MSSGMKVCCSDCVSPGGWVEWVGEIEWIEEDVVECEICSADCSGIGCCSTHIGYFCGVCLADNENNCLDCGSSLLNPRDEESDSESELDDDEEAYRHYECAVCEKDIEGVGTFNQEVLCLECEEHILQQKKNIKTDEDGKICKKCGCYDTYAHFADTIDGKFVLTDECKGCYVDENEEEEEKK